MAQKKHTCKLSYGRYHHYVHVFLAPNSKKQWWQILDDWSVQHQSERGRAILYPKNSVELSSCKILNLDYAIGKVMYTRHGG
jgi:hypothetical protein